jgi:hypothetical protein
MRYRDPKISSSDRKKSSPILRRRHNYLIKLVPSTSSAKSDLIHSHSTSSRPISLLDLLCLLPFHLHLFLPPPRLLPCQLIRPSQRNRLGPEVTESALEHLLHHPTAHKVHHHRGGHDHFELGAERHQAQLGVQLGDELGAGAKGDEGAGDQPPVHAAVLADGLAEGSALVVDGEGGDLLDELEEVDGRVEEGGLEFAFEVDGRGQRFRRDGVDVVGNVDEGGDVDGELAEDGADDVEIEDVGLRALFRKAFDGLGRKFRSA